jgi:NADH-quinone oxidoreductase subunit N
LSIAFKFNVLPFTKWILSFYETIPTTILAYITTIPKLGYTLFSINFFIKIFNTDFYLLQITFILLGSITLIYSLIGFVETNVKRILAYSSIFHGGLFYILLASQSITGVILYSILYNTTMFVLIIYYYFWKSIFN